MKYFTHREAFLLITAIFCVCIIYTTLPQQTKTTYGTTKKKGVFTMSSSYSLPCEITLMDPWDPSIQKYYQKLPPLVCSRSQYDLLKLLPNGTLIVDALEKAKLGYDITCSYRCYDKVLKDDETLNYTTWFTFKETADTNCEFFEVTCKRDSWFPTTVYYNNLNRIIPKPCAQKSYDKYSVVLFVMDSVSHSHWRRSLPKTYKILYDKYQSIVFHGMTKVGDNSFPNAVAMLSGLKSASEFGDITGFYDNHPLIWTDFKHQGYTTYYAEDYPNFNLFYYLAKGFKGKPVDHYFRPFWLNVYGSYLHRRSTNLCYGNEPLHKIQLNYFQDFVRKYNGTSVFALNWLTELGHDYMNQVQGGDNDIAAVFDDNYEYLKNSFVFVLSDHGHRFDAIRETLIGRKEEQLPFFSVHLPEDLVAKHPRMKRVVEKNAKKLASFWDFHTTLRDILHLSRTGDWQELEEPRHSLEIEKKMRKYSKRGMSLLRSLPERSCQEAEIPYEYCTCRQEKSVNVNSSATVSAAEYLLSQVNAIISPYPQCMPLLLSRIVDANQEEESTDLLRIILEAKPSAAHFEGLLRRSANQIELVGEISRVNRYGNQSICVDSPIIRKYCYCRA